MKFDILNKFTGKVIFTADIDECAEDELPSIQLGLAVKCAVENHANLSYANLSSADLSSADLRSANLNHADLYSADLRSADLNHANLSYANLSSANLNHADLYSANLNHADLSYADLSAANLSYVDLSSADLSSADLSAANLNHADLRSADLVVILLPIWTVYVQSEYTRIGCKYFKNSEWLSFTDKEIAGMDNRALEWCTEYKPLIEAAIKSLN